MTLLDFISGFGGFCGLCLGFSFVSIVEILYWFSIKLCRNFCQMGRFKEIIGDEGSTAQLTTYIAYSACTLFHCSHCLYAYTVVYVPTYFVLRLKCFKNIGHNGLLEQSWLYGWMEHTPQTVTNIRVPAVLKKKNRTAKSFYS